jgi:hypothetical protein
VNTAGPAVYEYCGLRIRSTLALHLPTVSADEWDVDVRSGDDVDGGASAEPPGELVAWFGESERDWWYRATSTPAGFLIRFRNRGDFVVSRDLSTVEVRCDPSGDPAFLPVLAAGTVTAFLLTLRGRTVLHASAVAIDGRALAFVGPSGIGKSTLAAMMCLEGAALVTDDVLAVEAGPPVTAVGGSTELRLRNAAAPLADLRREAPRRMTADDRTAVALMASPPGPLPLAAIVVPVPSRTTSVVDVVRLEPSRALAALLASPRIHGWRLAEVLSRDFTTQCELANRTPVYAATIPWGPPFDPSIVRSLSALGVQNGQPTDAATARK